jgi:hypothetical protein
VDLIINMVLALGDCRDVEAELRQIGRKVRDSQRQDLT